MFIYDKFLEYVCILEFYKVDIFIMIQNFNIDNYLYYSINIFLVFLYKEYFLSNIFLNKKFKVYLCILFLLINSFDIQVFLVLYEYCWMDGLVF